MTASFVVQAEDKETKHLKYVWNFGDGHKSYLKETSHKYLKPRRYSVKLAVSDQSQTIEKIFRIDVRKYPRPKIEIVELTPNPSGRDAEFETLVLKNNSSREIDLKNYKIATGSKNLYNHPILQNLLIKAGEEKLITRKDSRFTLNNKVGKVLLVYPDGKIADAAEYVKDKIADDELYAKIEGKWQWISPPENKDQLAADLPEKESGVVAGAAIEDIPNATCSFEYTPEDAFIFLNVLGIFSGKEEINYCSINQNSFSFSYLLAKIIS